MARGPKCNGLGDRLGHFMAGREAHAVGAEPVELPRGSAQRGVSLVRQGGPASHGPMR